MLSTSKRRLTLCLAVLSVCILLPALGFVWFYDMKDSIVMLGRQVYVTNFSAFEVLHDEQNWKESTQTAIFWSKSELTPILPSYEQPEEQHTFNEDLHATVPPVLKQTILPSYKQLEVQHTFRKDLYATVPPVLKRKNSPKLFQLQHSSSSKKTALQSHLIKKIHHKKKLNKFQNNYILALDYWDQQTSALRNLLSLQCWASHFGHWRSTYVVEPFIVESRLGALPMTDDERRSQIRFQDLFDINQWKNLKHSKGVTVAHLVSWTEFLLNAPKKIILVTIGYSRFGKPCTQTGFANGLREHCSKFLTTHKFKVVREVCIDMLNMTTRTFDVKIFGDLYYRSGVTIIFRQWRGIQQDRISLTDSLCHNGIGFIQLALNLRTSPRLINDMKKYIHTYYREEQVYTALVLRLEKVIINSDEGQALYNVKKCLNRVVYHWSNLKNIVGSDSTFLAIDYGKFGTSGFSSPFRNTSEIEKTVESFIRSIFGKEITLRIWEQTFENVTDVTNSGYIAMMQSSIAARSKCILLAGGGTFQDHTLHLYQQIPRLEKCFLQFNEKCNLRRSSVPKY